MCIRTYTQYTPVVPFAVPLSRLAASEGGRILPPPSQVEKGTTSLESIGYKALS